MMIDPFITMGELIEPIGFGWFILSGLWIPWMFICIFLLMWYLMDDHYKTMWKLEQQSIDQYLKKKEKE